MASRPVFISEPTKNGYIREIEVDFEWFPGMSIIQKQKSIDSLHKAISEMGYEPILEISSKSKNNLGVKLSAFNLYLKITDELKTSVESAYQGSKVFANGGPYVDLYYKSAREAKKDERLNKSGQLKGFELNGVRWELIPETAFYDWLYINALIQNEKLAKKIIKYKAFTDIEYNPKKQYSCQARSAAYYVSLSKLNLLENYLNSEKNFLKLYSKEPATNEQLTFNL